MLFPYFPLISHIRHLTIWCHKSDFLFSCWLITLAQKHHVDKRFIDNTVTQCKSCDGYNVMTVNIVNVPFFVQRIYSWVLRVLFKQLKRDSVKHLVFQLLDEEQEKMSADRAQLRQCPVIVLALS